MNIKFSKEKPPIYEECKKKFDIDWDKGVIFTYGDTIYCKLDLSEDLVVHEKTHVKQQLEYGVEKWWGRYLDDKDFRLSQEVEAYRNQLAWLKENANRKYRKFMFNFIVKCMVGMYGGMCTEKEAIELLK